MKGILQGWVRPLAAAALAASTLCSGGCMDITGRGPAPLAKTVQPDETQARPRAGHVYCMRGWLGIFSTGMDDLAQKLDKEVTSISVADEEWRRLKGFLIQEHRAGRLKEPLVLVGHSWGADDQIRVASELAAEGITVDLLITIDPVTPPAIPTNVRRCVNIYKSHPVTDGVPFWRGVPLDTETTRVPIANINLREAKVGFDTESIDHINIEKSVGVHQMVMEEVRKVCPMRTAGNLPAQEAVMEGTAQATTPTGSAAEAAHHVSSLPEGAAGRP